MQITVELPDDLAEHPEPGREALEALAIAGYRTEALAHHEAAALLGLTRIQFDGFLKERNIFDHAYSLEDLKQDFEAVERFEAEQNLIRQRPPAA